MKGKTKEQLLAELEQKTKRQKRKYITLRVSSYLAASIVTGAYFHLTSPMTEVQMVKAVATYDEIISKQEAKDLYELLDDDMSYQKSSAIILDYLKEHRDYVGKTYQQKEGLFFTKKQLPEEVAVYFQGKTENGEEKITKYHPFSFATYEDVFAWTAGVEKMYKGDCASYEAYSVPEETSTIFSERFCTWHYQDRDDKGFCEENGVQWGWRLVKQTGITFAGMPYILYLGLKKVLDIPNNKEIEKNYQKKKRKINNRFDNPQLFDLTKSK